MYQPQLDVGIIDIDARKLYSEVVYLKVKCKGHGDKQSDDKFIFFAIIVRLSMVHMNYNLVDAYGTNLRYISSLFIASDYFYTFEWSGTIDVF